jgi:23S rRNA (guanine745-N1)-methyltransferase
MHPEVVARLRCPVCARALADNGAALRCGAGHSFDLARQGYADLTAGRATHAGDTADMVTARDEVLARGYFDVVTRALIAASVAVPSGLAVDVGAGTGFHLAALLAARPDLVGLAVDVSKPALRRSARAHERMSAVRADAWRSLPVADGAASGVLNVFAPRAGAELRRVLRADGALIVVTPRPEHLRELVQPLGLLGIDGAKDERLAAGLGPFFTRSESTAATGRSVVSRADAAAMAAMGPSAWHVDRASVHARLAAQPDPLGVTVAVSVSVWRPRAHPETAYGAEVGGRSGLNPVAGGTGISGG